MARTGDDVPVLVAASTGQRAFTGERVLVLDTKAAGLAAAAVALVPRAPFPIGLAPAVAVTAGAGR